MKRKKLSALVLVAAALFFFAACTSFSGPSQERSENDKSPEASGTGDANGGNGAKPAEEGSEENGESRQKDPAERKEFVYCISPPAVNLDPLHTFTSTEAQVYTALYEGLVTYNPFTLQPSPGVAERWEKSENGTVYRFFIRSNARYSNGDYIEAAHVRDTLLKLIDPEEDAEYADLLDVVKNAKAYRKGEIDEPEEVGISVEGEGIVKFELEHPASHFIKILCHHSFSPLHPSMRDDPDWQAAEEVVSNGPFFISKEGDEELILKKNKLYWDSASIELETLRIIYRDDEEEVTKSFNKGDIHWTEAPVNYDKIADRDALVINHLFATSYYFFSSKSAPYNNPAVRRALSLMLPWTEIRSSEYMYIPTSTLVPQIGSYPEIEGIAGKNEEEAQSLLAKEGFPGGTGLPAIKILIPEGEESRRIAESMEKAWEEKLDLIVSVEGSDFHSYYDRLKEEAFTVGTLTWIGDFADPLTFLNMWTSDSNLNISQYSQPEYDELIRKSLEQTGEERYKTMSEAEKILLSGAAIMPIKHSPAFNVIDLEYIEGWFPNPLDIHPFKYVRFGTPSIPEGVVRAPGASVVPVYASVEASSAASAVRDSGNGGKRP